MEPEKTEFDQANAGYPANDQGYGAQQYQQQYQQPMQQQYQQPMQQQYQQPMQPMQQQFQQPMQQQYQPPMQQMQQTKFCKFCASQIPMDAVVCTSCGRQVEQFQGANNGQQPQIVINNSSSANANAMNGGMGYMGKRCSKWVAFFLCLFLGELGAHKFYEGKAGMGILYLFTLGLFGIGWVIDLIVILCKPDPYYV